MTVPGFSLSNVSSLEHYIQSVYQIPMLTEAEEYELATRFHEHQDKQAASRLVMSHLRVVVSVARGYLGYGLQQADLIQEGNVGLMKAVKRFEPSRGVRLFSFAIHWIRAEIHEFIIRNWRLVRVATSKPQRKLFFNLRKMKEDRLALSDEDAIRIATDLDVRVEDVREMDVRMHGGDVPLLAEDSDDTGLAPIDWLADETHEPTHQLEARDHAFLHGPRLEQALKRLDDRSRYIIESRWMHDADNSKTLHVLAHELGISAERVRQIESKALQTLKSYLLS
jgi:RNA polymerase sigma-32 factor